MAQWWNSSIKAWESFDGSLFLDTDGDVDLPYRDPLQPCQYVNWTLPSTDESTFGQPLPIKTNVSCAQICNDSISLFGSQQNNLINCGLWSTLVSAYIFVDRSIQVADRSLLKAFEEVGLDTSVPQYIEWATTYMDTIGACFMYLYQNVKQYTFADDGTVLGSCTIEALFTYSPNMTYNITNFYDDTILGTLDQLRDCVEDICSPVTLNPDLAGIGVSGPPERTDHSIDFHP